MKKFILMIFMSLFVVTMTSAQHVQESKAFDNVYVTLSASGVLPTTDFQVGTTEFRENWRPQFGIEVGKSLTTLYTTGLEFTSAVNTTGAKTAFDEFNLLWLHKVNMSNVIWGYNPERHWEVQAVGGLGWGHETVIRDNYGVIQAGLEVSYNINDTWSIMAKPKIEWERVNDGLNVNNSNVGLAVGVSFKFPNRDGSRGFVVCDRDFYVSEYNRMNAEINELRQRYDGQVEINNQLNERLAAWDNHVCKVDTVVIDNTIAPTIGFIINSSELTPATDAYLYNIAQVHKDLVVKGYADAQTGNPEYNMELSKKRAEAVKAKLLKYGATNVEIEAYGDTVQPFSDNDLNRVAIVIKK